MAIILTLNRRIMSDATITLSNGVIAVVNELKLTQILVG